ncbi:hypothetical protein BJ166DRAFT_517949 [Pestalotiopsis sp. NC0098]|nr:hypothetical protein BJ166DRAFT_517949 [Pestalotiopsis sp. NC0098]
MCWRACLAACLLQSHYIHSTLINQLRVSESDVQGSDRDLVALARAAAQQAAASTALPATTTYVAAVFLLGLAFLASARRWRSALSRPGYRKWLLAIIETSPM